MICNKKSKLITKSSDGTELSWEKTFGKTNKRWEETVMKDMKAFGDGQNGKILALKNLLPMS